MFPGKVRGSVHCETPDYRVFHIVPPPSRRGGGIENFTEVGIFLPGERNLRRSDFDNLNFFKAKNSFLRILNIN